MPPGIVFAFILVAFKFENVYSVADDQVIHDYLVAEESRIAQAKIIDGTETLLQGPSSDMKWYQDTLAWCMQIESGLDFFDKTAIRYYRNYLNSLHFVDQRVPIVLEGPLTFETPLNVLDMQVGAKLLTNSDPTYEVLSDKSFQKLKDVEKHLEYLNGQENALQRAVKDALKLEGNQVITGEVHGSEVHFSCGCFNCTIDDLSVKTMNGKDMNNFDKQLIPLYKNIVLSPIFNLDFASLEVRSDLSVSNINGIDPRQIVTKDRDFTLNGDLIVPTVHVDSLTTGGAINGQHISSKSFLTRHGDQFLDGQVTFVRSLAVKNLNANCHYDQINKTFNTFLNSIVQNDPKTSLISIASSKYFNRLQVNGNLELDSGPTLSGVDMNNLRANMITRSGDQLIPSDNFTVENLVAENIEVSAFNGQQFSVNNFVRRIGPGESVVRARKTFTAPIDAHNVNVVNYLNDRPVRNGSLDLMLKQSNQVVNGHKYFRSLNLRGQAFLNGNINGLSLSHSLRAPVQGGRMVKLNGPVSAYRIEVTNLINNLNFSDLYHNYITINQPHTYTDLAMQNVVFKAPITCKMVNGISFNQYFLTKYKPQTVLQPISLNGPVVVNSRIDVHSFNNNSLQSYLSDSLRRHDNQTFIGHQILDGNLVASKLQAHRINNRYFSDLILLNTNESIIGPIEFRNVIVSRPYIKDVKEVKNLNDQPADDLIHNALVLAEMLHSSQDTQQKVE